MKNISALAYICILLLYTSACKRSTIAKGASQESKPEPMFDYSGSASVSHGFTLGNVGEIFECSGGRPTKVGIIKTLDGKEWVVPSLTNFTNESFPFSSDLHNLCNGSVYSNLSEAVSQLDESDIVVVDGSGDLFSAYIFADNYFEMYINGVPVGKDKVPFTKFNSSIVRFKVKRPFTIAMKLVDWEEALGLGTEKNSRSEFHAGDGGMTAVIMDDNGKIIAVTNDDWKAQTFYTAPIKDLSCIRETGSLRISHNCDDSDSENATAFYGLHWEVPSGWETKDFDDADWPSATTYTNDLIGVDNKPAYTNFKDIFDDPINDAVFIWSTNVVLDNEVLVRYSVR